jgi:hypothetical protein
MRSRKFMPHGLPRKWVSLPKVARRLGLSGEAALALIKSGALPARLVGGVRWFVDIADLDAFVIRRHQPRGAA